MTLRAVHFASIPIFTVLALHSVAVAGVDEDIELVLAEVSVTPTTSTGSFLALSDGSTSQGTQKKDWDAAITLYGWEWAFFTHFRFAKRFILDVGYRFLQVSRNASGSDFKETIHGPLIGFSIPF